MKHNYEEERNEGRTMGLERQKRCTSRRPDDGYLIHLFLKNIYEAFSDTRHLAEVNGETDTSHIPLMRA